MTVRRALQTQSTERLSIRCMSFGVITFVVVMSLLAFFLVQWQFVTAPVEAAAHYVPRPMIEMVTGWETVDYIGAPMARLRNHESELDSVSVGEPTVSSAIPSGSPPTGLPLTGLQQAGDSEARIRTGHPWWWQIQS